MTIRALKLNYSIIYVEKGKTFPILAYAISDDNSSYSQTWSSSNSVVASVDQNGVVTGVSEGEAIITAAIDSNTISRCYVTVTPIGVAQFEKEAIITTEDYVYTPNGIRPSLTKITAAFRGATNTEDHINFFGELLHDILLANTTFTNLDNSRSANFRKILGEMVSNDKHNVPNGMKMFKEKVAIRDVSTIGIDKNIKSRIITVQDKLDNIDENTKY